MRIALLHPKFDRSGGAEGYALGLARGLAARGYEVHLYGRRGAAGLGGAQFHRVPCLPWGRTLKTWSFWRMATRALAGRDFDLVQGFGKTSNQTVHRVGGGTHRAYLERTGVARPRRYDRLVFRIEDELYAAPGLRAVICPSRLVREDLTRHYPWVEPLTRLVPNGVDTEAYRPAGRERDRAELRRTLGVPGDAPLALFVAHNFALKGLDRALEALTRLPGFHLVVCGAGPAEPFRQRAREAGSAAWLHFLGPRTGLSALYRACDVLLHPTRYDPFANVSLEALACGTPLVTTPENGAAEVLGGCPAVQVVAGDQWGDAAPEAVRRLTSAAGAVREAARAAACRHGQAAHLDAVEAVYRQVAALPGGRP